MHDAHADRPRFMDGDGGDGHDTLLEWIAFNQRRTGLQLRGSPRLS